MLSLNQRSHGTTADLIATVLFAYFVEEDFSPINEKTRGLGL